jgi:hypothetical protein
MLLRGRVLALLAIALATGCDKKSPPPSAPPSAALPPQDPNAPAAVAAPGDRPTHAPSGSPHAHMDGLPQGHPPLGGAAGAGAPGTAEQTTPGNLPFDKASVVSGVLRLDDKVKAKVASGDVIYLVARNAETPGPPLAVKRLTVASWPITFSLDNRDAMFEGTQMKGKVVVQARVDKDGDAATKTPGDVTGTSRPIQLPADKVVITFDTVL